MIVISVSNHKVVNINRASVTLEIDGICYFATKKVCNKILHNLVDQVIVVEKEYNGSTLKWLALPSIF